MRVQLEKETARLCTTPSASVCTVVRVVHVPRVRAVLYCAARRSASLATRRTQFNSIQFNSIQFNSIQFNSIQFNSIQFNSIQFNSIQFNSIQFNSIQFNSIHSGRETTRPRMLRRSARVTQSYAVRAWVARSRCVCCGACGPFTACGKKCVRVPRRRTADAAPPTLRVDTHQHATCLTSTDLPKGRPPRIPGLRCSAQSV